MLPNEWNQYQQNPLLHCRGGTNVASEVPFSIYTGCLMQLRGHEGIYTAIKKCINNNNVLNITFWI